MASLSLLLLAFCIVGSQAQFGDLNLENLLNNLDDFGKNDRQQEKTSRFNSFNVGEPPRKHRNLDNVPERPNKRIDINPCEDVDCGWGKECMVDPKTGEKSCECIRSCPDLTGGDPFDKACSNQNETYPSICDLYRERCLCKRGQPGCQSYNHAKAHLQYLGECKQLPYCDQTTLSQFAKRMSDWLFHVMKNMKDKQMEHGAEWLDMMETVSDDEHMQHVYPIIWKFCDLDVKPHDSVVTKQELIPVTAFVTPMESCIGPFLESCDTDNDGHITLNEWGKCLGLKQEDIIEHC